MNELRTNFQWYLENQPSLVKSYGGKFLVIANKQVIAHFDSDFEALQYASEKLTPGSFIIQKCTSGEKDYTQAFHSRVVFA